MNDDELEFVVTHVADCETCEKRFVEELRRRHPNLLGSVGTRVWFRNVHLEIDDLAGLADKTLDSELKEIFGIHLKSCKRCREDLSSFLYFRTTKLFSVEGLENGSEV